MKCLGGRDIPMTAFDDDLFSWWEQQIITMDDYPYVGMDFRGDSDLALPLDAS